MKDLSIINKQKCSVKAESFDIKKLQESRTIFSNYLKKETDKNISKIILDMFCIFNETKKEFLMNDINIKVKDYIISLEDFLKEAGIDEKSPENDKIAYTNDYKLKKTFLLIIDFNNIPGYSVYDKITNIFFFTSILGANFDTSKYIYNTDFKETEEKYKYLDNDTIIKNINNMLNNNNNNYYNFNGAIEVKHISANIRDYIGDYDYFEKELLIGENYESYEHLIPIDIKKIKIQGEYSNLIGEGTSKNKVTKTVVTTGGVKRNRRIDSVNKIKRIRPTEMAKETFEKNLINQEIIIKENIKIDNILQHVYLLVDASASMNSRLKQSYIRAIILDYMKKVVNKEIKLTFSFYTYTINNKIIAEDKQSASDLYQYIYSKIPTGGGTNIGGCLQNVIDDVSSDINLINPEITIILDGDDVVRPEQLDFKNVKINAIIIGKTNKGIKKVCDLTEGTYIEEVIYGKNVKSEEL